MAARAEKRFAPMPETAYHIRLRQICDESLRAHLDAAQEQTTLLGADEAVAATTTGRRPTSHERGRSAPSVGPAARRVALRGRPRPPRPRWAASWGG